MPFHTSIQYTITACKDIKSRIPEASLVEIIVQQFRTYQYLVRTRTIQDAYEESLVRTENYFKAKYKR